MQYVVSVSGEEYGSSKLVRGFGTLL